MKKLNTLQFIEKAALKHNNLYDYSLAAYSNSQALLTIICTKHGEFLQRPAKHLFGAGCPTCYTESRNLSTEQFINNAKLVHRDRYSYEKVKYASSMEKVIITCKKHGDFLQRPNDHMSGRGCKLCNNSLGETAIANYLSDRRINFEQEKIFTDCYNPVTGRLLRFDFYLPDHRMLIEFDGKQHFIPESFGTDKTKATMTKNLEVIKFRDLVKTGYAQNNDIKLVRISYKEIDKISDILNSVITDY